MSDIDELKAENAKLRGVITKLTDGLDEIRKWFVASGLIFARGSYCRSAREGSPDGTWDIDHRVCTLFRRSYQYRGDMVAPDEKKTQ